jgi:hypothetical protein
VIFWGVFLMGFWTVRTVWYFLLFFIYYMLLEINN